MSLQNRGLRAAMFGLVALVVAGIFATVFQTEMRYRYERLGGILWRVDQVTNERCRVLHSGLDCSLPASISISKSVSVSTSTSVGLTAHRHVAR